LSGELPIREVIEKRPEDIHSPVLAIEMMGVLPTSPPRSVV
jgi:hypothetical protein